MEPLKKVLFFAASCDICFANCNTIWYYQSVFPPYKYLFLMRAAKRCLVYYQILHNIHFYSWQCNAKLNGAPIDVILRAGKNDTRAKMRSFVSQRDP